MTEAKDLLDDASQASTDFEAATNPERVRMVSLILRWAACALLVLTISGSLVAEPGQDDLSGERGPGITRSAPSVRQHAPDGAPLQPPLPDVADLPVQLVLDDNTSESDFGLVGAESRPFLWFNRFTPTPPFSLEQMWVLFPQDSTLAGADVELVVFQDPDGDPTNGAQWLASFNVTVQATDGVTFSIYDLLPAVEITAGDAYLGVVSRYAQTATPPTFPATLDTGASQGRSWVATWLGDPPVPPTLPADDETFLIDDFLGGNWLIRGFGRSAATPAEIPTLNAVGLGFLIMLLSAGGAAVILRRRHSRSSVQSSAKR